MCLISLYVQTQIYVFVFEAKKGLEEGCNSTHRDKGQARSVYVE